MQGEVKWIEYRRIFLTMRNLKYAMAGAQEHFESSSLEKKQASLSGVPRKVGKGWLGVGVGSLSITSYLGEERKGRKTPASVGFCCELASGNLPQGSLPALLSFCPKGYWMQMPPGVRQLWEHLSSLVGRHCGKLHTEHLLPVAETFTAHPKSISSPFLSSLLGEM